MKFKKFVKNVGLAHKAILNAPQHSYEAWDDANPLEKVYCINSEDGQLNLLTIIKERGTTQDYYKLSMDAGWDEADGFSEVNISISEENDLELFTLAQEIYAECEKSARPHPNKNRYLKEYLLEVVEYYANA